MKVYADNDVISVLRKWDQPAENAAIRQVKDRSDKGDIVLLISAVHDREAARLPEEYKPAQHEILALLPKVEFVEDHKLLGFNNQDLGRYGWISSPLVADDPIARRLREIGLDRTDAHHVMLATSTQCDVFLTCDQRTILMYRTTIEAEFPIRLMLPSEFVQQYPAA